MKLEHCQNCNHYVNIRGDEICKHPLSMQHNPTFHGGPISMDREGLCTRAENQLWTRRLPRADGTIFNDYEYPQLP